MKIAKVLGVILLLMCIQGASAVNRASVSNVRYEKQGGKYIIKYDLKSDAIINLSVRGKEYGSNVNKDIYVTGKKENVNVTGDVGYVMAGYDKVIEWNQAADEEFSNISYVSEFQIEPKNIFSPAKTILLGTFGYSFKPKQMSYGLFIGATSNKNGWGGFAHFRSNFNFGVNTEFTCDADGRINYFSCFYTGETKTLYYMANAGILVNMLKDRRAKSMFALGLGIGYGQRNVYWQMDSKEWALNEGLTNKGVSAELNLIGSIKGFTVMAGVNTLNFKYFELEVGIGVTF